MEPINPYAAPQAGPLVDEHRQPAVPITLADTLRLGTSLYLANLLSISAITLAFWVPLELTQTYLTYFTLDPDDVGQSFRLTLLCEVVVGIIPESSIMAIAAAALRGQVPSFRLAFVAGFAAWPRVFVTRLTVSISIVLGMVLFIVPGLYIAVRTAVAEPAALIEHRGGMSAPGRSFELTQGRFWRTLGLLCIVYGFLVAVGFVFQIPQVFFDHWLLSAALAVVIDMLAAWAIVILVTAYWASYWSSAHSPQSSIAEAQSPEAGER